VTSDKKVEDLILQELLKTGRDLEPIRYFFEGRKLLLTGGTGFFGKWLSHAIYVLNQEFGWNLEVFILSRNPSIYLENYPYFKDQKFFQWIIGDVRTPPQSLLKIDYLLHAATESGSTLNADDPLKMVDVVVNGTINIFDLATRSGVTKGLFVSSGAVYGAGSPGQVRFGEDSKTAPNQLQIGNAYGESKRTAELIAKIYTDRNFLPIVIARCFAFSGPFLPVDAHFAIGNFVRDCIEGRPIKLTGDGSPLRSYMHGSDLVIWLLCALAKGEGGRAYNVGSETYISIRDLAILTCNIWNDKFHKKGVRAEILNLPPAKPLELSSSYVPDTQRAKKELGLQIKVPLEDSIIQMFQWNLHLKEIK
jgi:dTDP-glucose 4,6-dehydratase